MLEGTGGATFWRAVAMLALKLPVTVAALALGAAPLALAVGLLVLGTEGLSGDTDVVVGPWALGPALGAALCALALPAAVVAIAVHDGIGRLLRALAQALLRSDVAGAGPVREMLAERLGDRSLNIAYWLPDREIFVDERGHQVELPRAGSGRAWTAVEREGTRVAAIVHDAELDATPELVHAAASAAALAIDNERLKADLRAPGNIGHFLDFGGGAELGRDWHRRREADLVEAVVEREREALEAEDLVVEGRAERERQVAVGDRAAERRLLRALAGSLSIRASARPSVIATATIRC